jgi:hypothetical protein
MAHDGETSGSIKTIVDGGTTRHIFGELLVFDRSSLKDVKSTIKLMDQSTTKSSKRGTAVLVNRVQSQSVAVKLTNSAYSPTSGINLLSQSQLIRDGYIVTSTQTEIYFTDPLTKRIVIYSKLHADGLFYVTRLRTLMTDFEYFHNNTRSNSTSSNTASLRNVTTIHPPKTKHATLPTQSFFCEEITDDFFAHLAESSDPGIPPIDLWHRRCCHLNEGYVKKARPEVHKGAKLCFCDACVMAQSHRRPYSNTEKT